MKDFGRYISRQIAGFTVFVLGLALLNLAVFAGSFYGIIVRDYGAGSPKNRLEETAAACSAEGIDPGMEQRLAESGVWAMFLSPQGKRLWGANLPGGLPEEYTVQQVAVFAKGYLAGYPVFLQTAEDGLLVLGYPQGSYTKLTRNYWPMAFIKALPGCAAVMLVADLALLFAGYFFSKRKILKGTGPLLEAVEALAKGERIDLEMRGELEPVAGSLNRASHLLARQNEARANWISGVSHDIRTPLSMIMGYAGRIACDEGASPAVRAQAQRIGRQGEAIRELVQDLNLASRLEYEMQPLHREPVHVAKLMRAYAAGVLNGGLAGGYSLEVEIAPNAQQAVLACDARLVERALANLVQNSIRHNPGGCKVKLLLEQKGTSLALTVRDNGIGIPPNKLAALAQDRPAEAYGANERLESRHGLGLALVQRIAQAHGGCIKIESGSEKGCEVTLLFPWEAE